MGPRIFDAFTAREEQVKDYLASGGMQAPAPVMGGPLGAIGDDFVGGQRLDIEQPMRFDNFGMGPPTGGAPSAPTPANIHLIPLAASTQPVPIHAGAPTAAAAAQPVAHMHETSRAQRNPSVLSYGNNGLRGSLRGMSITSETTFGRAMSGLSALSIDWENLDDFDLEVDHSAHIDNQSKRPSVRRSIMSTGSGEQARVSFRI
jgi:hypothetical protein